MKQSKSLLFVLLFIASYSVEAHTGLDSSSSLMDGLIHPWTGIDHILAMIAVGLWSSTLRGVRRILLPVLFLSAIIMGALIGNTGLNIPFAETWVALTVVVLGLILISKYEMNAALSLFIVSLFACLHGYVHVFDGSVKDPGFDYVYGIVLSTCMLLGLGFLTGNLQKTIRLIFAWFCTLTGMLLLTGY